MPTCSGSAWGPEFIERIFPPFVFNYKLMNIQTNANKSSPSKSARRRRQRQRRNGQNPQQAGPAQKSTQPNPSRKGRSRQRRPRARGAGFARGPLGIDAFGSPWEEKSGMTGVGATSSIRTSRRDMVIEESEFVGAVNVANEPNFNVTAYPINPGQAALFPWLSTIAKQFEKYRFEKLAFVYKKEVSEYATAGQTGKVILSIDYDASDPPPATKQQMEDTIPHADAMPCQSFSLPLDPRDMNATATDAKFVRVGGLPGAADIKTYDVGNLNVATQGIPSNTEVGELHVVYRCRLMKPVLENLAGPPANNSVSLFQSTTTQTYTSATPATALNATAVANGVNVVNTAGSMVPPPGNYLVDLMVWAADTVNEELSVKLDFQKNATSLFRVSPPVSEFAAVGSAGSGTVSASIYVSANGTDAFTQVITLGGAAGVLTGTSLIRWTAI